MAEHGTCSIVTLQSDLIVLADVGCNKGAGHSGLAFDRSGLTALREALRRGEFVRLVVAHPDRLSRRQDDRWLIENEAARAGCRIVYVAGEEAVWPER